MLESFPLPELAQGEALVRVRCATICGSDLHTLRGRRECETPCILGHEMVGNLVAANGVTSYEGEPLEIGARVTWSMVWSCGACFYCERGLLSKCERLFKFGHAALGKGRDLTGAYAEHCHLPAGTAIFRVPDNVPDEIAAPANCATATVAAVMRHAGEVAGQNVVVLGAGMLGLTACAMLRTAGAAQVIAVDRDPARASLASQFGATQAHVADDSFTTALMAATGGHGADMVLDFAGTPEAGEAAFGLLRSGGHLVMAGAVFPSRPLALSGEQMVRRMLRLTGVYNYQPRDLGEALRFLSGAQERFPFASLVGGRFPLAGINTAISFAEREKPARVAVIPL